MMLLVAVDPAARRFAAALFQDGVLEHVAYYASAPALVRRVGDRPAIWLLETPKNLTSFGVAHRDLDRLRKTNSKIAKTARERGETVRQIVPSAWKGNVPKVVSHNRFLAALTEAERKCLPDLPRADMAYAHDLYDAVGIGLVGLGRLGRGGRRVP